MKIITFAGSKGGTGKTTNSHAAAHGLVMLGIPTAYVLTDNRELPSDESRVYSIIDGRTIGQLEQAVATAKSHDGPGVLVVDGGGNRGPVDELIISVADLAILPFCASGDDVTTVAKDMARFTNAFAMPSNWTTNAKAKVVDQGYIADMEEVYPGRVLKPMSETHALKDLILLNFNGSLLPPAQRYCRSLARVVLELLER